MQKKKKKPESQKLPMAAVATEHPQPDVFLDNLVRVIGNFGFQQVLLPVVEERKNFSRFQELSRSFADNVLTVPDLTEGEMIMPPTKMPAVIRRYQANVKNEGPHVSKWFHLSPVLRFVTDKYESSHELGLYVLGEDSALASVQLINTAAEIFRELGSAEFMIQLNSLGCKACQKNYQELLQNHLVKGMERLCNDCEEDFEKNPLVFFRCVNLPCQELASSAPPIIDSLDEVCKTNLTGVLESIDELGIPYTLNPGFIPQFLGEQVVFQIVSADDPSHLIGYGGNFSPYAQEGNVSEPAAVMGFLTTFEKLMNTVPEERRRLGPKVEVFMVPLGSIAVRKAVALHRDLQHSGIMAAEAMLSSSSIKNQLKAAAEKKCEIALIIGQKEAIDETVILRDMRSGMQEIFAVDRIIEEVKKRLGK